MGSLDATQHGSWTNGCPSARDGVDGGAISSLSLRRLAQPPSEYHARHPASWYWLFCCADLAAVQEEIAAQLVSANV